MHSSRSSLRPLPLGVLCDRLLGLGLETRLTTSVMTAICTRTIDAGRSTCVWPNLLPPEDAASVWTENLLDSDDAMAYEKHHQYRVGNTATGGTWNIPTAVVF